LRGGDGNHYDTRKQEFVIDFENASEDKDLTYTGRERAALTSGDLKQTVPYAPAGDKVLDFDVFVDRSVVEIFVNSEICIVQRVYPTRDDSKSFRLFTRDEEVRVKNIVKWDMDATNPW
jgi:sucrose-6-phosphate hydrolase SacC (GH32 family)